MKLLSFASLPDWYKDNNFILSGYRQPNPSLVYCLKSLFYLHNESGNIFTHLIGSIFYIILFIYTINCNNYINKSDFYDKLIFSLFFFGITSCLLTSSIFHCLQCHSRRIFKITAKLDYCGITVNISTSLISALYYAFNDSPIARNLYICLVIVIGVISITISLFEKFSDPEFQSFRALLFIIIGLFGIAPFVHFCRYYNFDPISSQKAFRALILMISMATTYISGAIIYIIKIPERFNPGFFDMWFNSHQLFHLFVIGASIQYFHSLSLLAEVRLNYTSAQNLTNN